MRIFKLSLLVLLASSLSLLTGCGGKQLAYDPIVITGADFSLAIAPGSQTITVAQPQQTLTPAKRFAAQTLTQSVQYTVTIDPSASFSGTVNLTVGNSNGASFGASLDKSSVTAASGAPVTAALTAGITSAWTTSQVGTFKFPVTATDGHTTVTQNASLVIKLGAGAPPASIFALFAAGSVNVDDSVSIRSAPTANAGNVYGGAGADFRGSGSVQGKIESADSVELSGFVVSGGTQSNVTPIPTPTLDTASVKTAAAGVMTTTTTVNISSGTATLTGLYTKDIVISGGTVTIQAPFYCEGEIDVSGPATVQGGTIFADGTVLLSGSASVDESGPDLAVVCGEDVNIRDSVTVGGIVFAPNSDINITGTAAVNGSCFSGGDININASATISRNTSASWPFQ